MGIPWIKVRTNLASEIEVQTLAATLNRPWQTVVGALVAFWSWADGVTTFGALPRCSRQCVDNIAGITGFASAMEAVRWLKKVRGGFVIPNFMRHNGDSAKRRGMSAARQSQYRSATAVTADAHQSKGEEKRPEGRSKTAARLEALLQQKEGSAV